MQIQTAIVIPWLLVALSLVLLCVGFVVSRIKRRALSERLAMQEMETRVLNERFEGLQHESQQQTLEYARQVTKLESDLDSTLQQFQQAQSDVNAMREIKEAHIQLRARFDEKESQLRAQEKMLEESKVKLLKEFELAAEKMFESKQQSFSRSSKESLENVLQPFRIQLTNFNKQVEDVYHKENVQRNQLIGQITELQKQTKQVSEEANNLASALKGDNKTQGQWGEIILERLLEQSGLVKGREYDTQLNFKDEAGKNYRPDVVIHLPEDKDIIVDAKVALVEYERFSSEEDQEQKSQYLKRHIEAIKNHIKNLSVKNYAELEGIKTIDFVFLFIPVEAAYVAAVQTTPELFKEAYDQNIMLVSPSSLMVALRTVETMWRYEKQNANAEKIASSAGKLYDQFVLLVQSLDDVGASLRRSQDAHDTAMKRLSSGRGNVLKRIEDLQTLGARTSKAMPRSMQTSDVEYLEKESDEGSKSLEEETMQNGVESKVEKTVKKGGNKEKVALDLFNQDLEHP